MAECEQPPGLVSDLSDLTGSRQQPGTEHGHLQPRSVAPIGGQLPRGDRLDDVVQVTGDTARVRPQAVADLLGFCEPAGP